ncbi:S8 family serine peptidase [Natranaerobius thermophilus JW/NM-WN-LF]
MAAILTCSTLLSPVTSPRPIEAARDKNWEYNSHEVADKTSRDIELAGAEGAEKNTPLTNLVDREGKGASSLDELLELYEVETLTDLDEELILVAKIKQGEGSDHKEIILEKGNLSEKTKSHGINLKVNHVYSEVFSGFSFQVSRDQLQDLFELSWIEEIHPVGMVETKGHRVYPQMEVERGWQLRPGSSLKGAGVNVAILDTGVDYTHSALGEGFGDGHKVVDGYDFVNRRRYPMDDEGHGTHVAGIIAADGEFQGIAPKANILAYKVLDEHGEGSTDDILAALDQIVRDRRRGSANAADIINMSFGSRQEYVGSLIADALESAVDEGISVVMAGGNEGPRSSTLDFPNYFPQHNDSIITVGSSGAGAQEVNISASGISGFIYGELMLYSPAPDIDGSARIEYIEGGNNYSDFTNWAGESYVEDKIALVERGEGTYREMAENAARAGAKALIIYNNDPGMFYGSLVEPKDYIPTISISRGDGLEIRNQLNEGNVWVRMSNNSRIANFSSRGPSSESTVKPDLVAPGKNVMSTWTQDDYSWSEGTSVSAAFVSGTVALMRQHNPGWSPDWVKSALMNSAEPLSDSAGRNYDPTTQGAGELRVHSALSSQTVVHPGSLSFDKIDYPGYRYYDSEQLTIYNNSGSTRRYRTRVNFLNGHEDLDIDPKSNTFFVSGGSKRELDLELSAATDSLPAGEYQGYVEIDDLTSARTFSIPFLVVMKEGQDHNVGLEISPYAVSQEQHANINVRISDALDRLDIELYDEDQNYIERLHSRTSTLGPGRHILSWRGQLSSGEPLDDGFYYLQANALPQGKDPTHEDNWLKISRKTAVDRTAPEIELDEQVEDLYGEQGEETILVDTSPYSLTGRVEDLSLEISPQELELKIDGEKVDLDRDGKFQHQVKLDEGSNMIDLRAEDWAKNSTELELEIIYDPHDIAVKLHDQELSLPVPPILDDGRILLPATSIVQALMGADMLSSLDAEQDPGDDEFVEISRQGQILKLISGEDTMYLADSSVEMERTPRVVDGHFFVPLKEIAIPLGIQLAWDEDERAVLIEDTTTEIRYRHHMGKGSYSVSDINVPWTVVMSRGYLLGRFLQDAYNLSSNPALESKFRSPFVDQYLENIIIE